MTPQHVQSVRHINKHYPKLSPELRKALDDLLPSFLADLQLQDTLTMRFLWAQLVGGKPFLHCASSPAWREAYTKVIRPRFDTMPEGFYADARLGGLFAEIDQH